MYGMHTNVAKPKAVVFRKKQEENDAAVYIEEEHSFNVHFAGQPG